MISVRFLRGDRAGLRWYRAGEVAGISDIEARRLLKLGSVEYASAAPPESPVPAQPPSAVEVRRTKPIRNLWRR